MPQWCQQQHSAARADTLSVSAHGMPSRQTVLVGVCSVPQATRCDVQVLVPVALMQPETGAMGGQAYMLVNRDDFPAMMAGHHGMPMMPHAASSHHPQQHHHHHHHPSGHHDHDHGEGGHDANGGLMDVLVGAAHRVEGGSGGHGVARGDHGAIRTC